MSILLETEETIAPGLGFSPFGPVHLAWLAAFLLFTVTVSLFYRRLKLEGRRKMRLALAAGVVADELLKMAVLFIGGNYMPRYLPLHLCSVNIFLVAWHALRPNKTLDNFLYTVCMPGALFPLFTPTWTALPPSSLMHIHSFTVHIELALYPIVLTAAGEIHPKLSDIPKCIGMLMAAAVPIYFINLLLGTNFMFLMEAAANNPLHVFEQLFGSHLWGFPIIITAILILMFTPWHLYDKRKEKLSHQAH